MKKNELHFDSLKESRDWYFVEYAPPITGNPFAIVQLTILNDFDATESCHLLNDGHEVMTLGALWCLLEWRREISVRLREIKAEHGIPVSTEVRWVKVSPAKVGFYQDWNSRGTDRPEMLRPPWWAASLLVQQKKRRLNP